MPMPVERCRVSVELSVDVMVPAHLYETVGGDCADYADLKEWLWQNHKDDLLRHLSVDPKPTLTVSSKTSISCCVPLSGGPHEERLLKEATPTTVVEARAPLPSLPRLLTAVLTKTPSPTPTDKKLQLLSKIAHVQRQFFQSESPKVVFGCLLEALLDLTDSEYGFIGEVKFENDDQTGNRRMFLQTHAITNIAWDQSSRQFYDENITQGLRFYNMNSLFGAALTSGKPVISNTPKGDARACGIPKGHPPLDFFLGIPFFNPNGELNGMVGIANKRPHGYTTDDIAFLEPFTLTCSNLIQAYKHIAENRFLIDTLEESVQRRTRELELANAELAAVNEQVKLSAAQQLEHFACMSHEIRTPLNCIIGMSNLIKDTEMTAMQDESIRMIVASGDLLLAIVNDVLDYAKLETENIEIDMKRSNLQETLHSVIHSIEMKAHSTQSVKPFFDVSIPEYVNIDSRRLQQVLFNLLGNAVKFSPYNSVVEFHAQLLIRPEYSNDIGDSGRGSAVNGDSNEATPFHHERSSSANGSPTNCPFHKPSSASSSPTHESATSCPFHKPTTESSSLDVPTQAPTRPKMTLRFVVKDYGKGIDEKDFGHIFQPFQQAASGKEEVSGGTGLGLAITKKLVTAMGGTISVDSKKGAWSTFTVDLPFVDDPVRVHEVAVPLQHWTVSLVGLVQQDNVVRVLEAYKVNVRKFGAMSDVQSAVMDASSSGQTGATHVCLVHEDVFDSAQCEALVTSSKTTILTFGPQFSVQHKAVAHHFRSLEQILPSVLVQTMVEKVQSQRSSKRRLTGEPKMATDFESLRILVAEDNLVNQKVLCGMLSRLGVKHVDVVNNGLLACERVEVQHPPYDVILMDQQMPIMGGVEACRRIVNRQQTLTLSSKTSKVVFVTAHVSPTFEAECSEAGGSGFLPKPFKLDQIAQCFRDVCA